MICAIMLDTKGPEIRTCPLEDGLGSEVAVEAGQEFIFYTDTSIKANAKQCSVTYKNITKVVRKDNIILVDDGLIAMRVKEVQEDCIITEVQNDGMLGGTKGVNLPGVEVDLPALTEKDISDIQFGVEQQVDIIAASFIRHPSNITEIRELEGVMENDIKIIAKIESQEGLDNFDKILHVADGIMVARGDLGVEIPLENVCAAQKLMIAKCNVVGKPVITATQMLESMIKNPRPTRAEATDVANAVYDGTDCVMLSGETAKGDYPKETVETMKRICIEAEKNINYYKLYRSIRESQKRPVPIADSVCSSCVKTAWDLDASLIIALTESGNTARLISKYRPECPVLCVTPSVETARQVLLSRSCIPYITRSMKGTEFVIQRAEAKALELGLVKSGDIVVVVSGNLEGVSGSINMMKIHVVSK
eukprot:TRINITY_DN1687_c0_g1_i9.p1 TRINITY_DN1687_c0_g1~~TRINITY_DN1687_c0_g1_i9.p1  ORF type:complete len:421 (-),score=158.26 TRINITY_DN1687_c0_g1_i9:513-1775(-)